MNAVLPSDSLKAGTLMKKRKTVSIPFSKTLNLLMKEKNIGVREAARLAGVGPSTIMSWKAGAIPEDYLAVKRLAQGLGTTMSFILTGESDVQSEQVSIAEVFDDGGAIFDGFAKITIQRLIPRKKD